MKKSTLILGLAVLIFVSAGFECSFTTAGLSDIKFGKNDKAEPATSTFNTGETIYAVVDATGIPSGKHKLTWKVTYDNVTGKGKGEEVGKKDTDLPGSAQAWTNFSTPLPGDYKVEATLTDDSGKSIASKSGVVKVTGSAPAAPPSSDDSKDDEKDEDN